MNILLINKFYYPRGGDCIVTLNTQKLLEEQGHKVAIFAMQHSLNLPNEWDSYFPSEVEFNGRNPISLLKALLRPFGWGVKKKYTQLLNKFQPDVVHLHNIHSQLSPIVAKIAHQRGIKVIWTMHDYKLICPRYDCTREGMDCFECSHNTSSVIKHKCMKGSLVASVIAYLEARYWNTSKTLRWVDQIICPSQFMANRLINVGINKEKIQIIGNFVASKRIELNTSPFRNNNSYCYIGRLSSEKGIQTLLEVATTLTEELIIIGDGPLFSTLKDKYKLNKHIKFRGHCSWNEIKETLLQSKFMVLPSECNENNPLSVIEALSLGTPVLGANIGGIPELITKECGLTFQSANPIDLKKGIKKMMESSFNHDQIIESAERRFSETAHYKRLIQIINKGIE